jgi:hypothetical protein
MMVCTALSAQTTFPATFLQWDFEAQTAVPNIGNSGQNELINIGGITSNYAAGVNVNTGTNQGQGYNTATYPVATAASEIAGIQINLTTVGHAEITLSWYKLVSNTGSSRHRLQYNLDRNNPTGWVNFVADDTNATNTFATTSAPLGFDNGLYVSAPLAGTATWTYRTADLSEIPGIANNPNLGIRFVTAHPSTGSTYTASNSTSTYAVTGTVRFDNITFMAGSEVELMEVPTASPTGGAFTEPQSVVLAHTDTDAFIYYTTDGSTPTTSSALYSAPIPISTTTTLKFFAVLYEDNDPQESLADQSSVVTETYIFPTAVATITALRNSTPGAYKLTGLSAVSMVYTADAITHLYIQDEGAAILIVDTSNRLSDTYIIGDGIQDITGNLSVVNGMMRFTPIADATLASASSVLLTPVTVTLSELVTNPLYYQARLVHVEDVTFTIPAQNYFNTNSATPINYTMSDDDGTFTFSTLFPVTDYYGVPIPTAPVDITGVITTNSASSFFTARNFADLGVAHIHGIPFAEFNFEANTPTNLFPAYGPGSMSIIGGARGQIFGGVTPTSGSGLGVDNFGINAPGPANETSGLQFEVSTVGRDQVFVSWNNRPTATAINRVRLQYTTDGQSWINYHANDTNAINYIITSTSATNPPLIENPIYVGFDNGLYVQSTLNVWHRRTANFTGIENVANNPLFAVRLVSAFPHGGTAYVSTEGGGYTAGGSVRYDNISFFEAPETPIASVVGGAYFQPIAVELSSATPGVVIYYTTDGSIPVFPVIAGTTTAIYEPSTPLPISETTTLRFVAVTGDFLSTLVATEQYDFPISVASVATLRAGTPSSSTSPIYYRLTGDVAVSMVYGDMYTIQDAVAGIVLYDADGVLGAVSIGDGMSDIVGYLDSYQGMLAFIPVEEPTEAFDVEVLLLPVLRNFEEITANHDNYEARLVTVADVEFDDTGVFEPATSYTVEDAVADYTFRTYFSGADYIGEPIPTRHTTITGLILSDGMTPFLVARELEDMDETDMSAVDLPIAAFAETGLPISAYGYLFVEADSVTVTLTCATPNATIYYTLDGYVPAVHSLEYTEPLTFTSDTTLRFFAVADDHISSHVVNAYYYFPIPVAAMESFRAKDPAMTEFYRFSGDAMVTLSLESDGMDMSYIQDDTGAILLADMLDVITVDIDRGDAVSELVGYLQLLDEMLAFVPVVDAEQGTSTPAFLEPITVSFATLKANHADYQSRLVRVQFVDFDAIGDFEYEGVYDISDPTDDYLFIATLPDADYIGDPIFTTSVHLSGLVMTSHLGDFLIARDLADFEPIVVSPVADSVGKFYLDPIVVRLSTTTADATIYYTIDGTTPTSASLEYDDVDGITLSQTTVLKFFATKAGMANSAVITVTYTFPINVASISELKTFSPVALPGTVTQALLDDPANIKYRITGEVYVSALNLGLRNQIFIQDDEAGILIDDAMNKLTTVLSVGDGVTGLVGIYNSFSDMHQFTPYINYTGAVTQDNELVVVDATFEQIIENHALYQSRLVRVNTVTFPTGPAGANFANGVNIEIADPTGSYSFRPHFFGVDYIGTPIPTLPVNLTGIILIQGNTNRIAARTLADFEAIPLPQTPTGLQATLDSTDVLLEWDELVVDMPALSKVSRQLDGIAMDMNVDMQMTAWAVDVEAQLPQSDEATIFTTFAPTVGYHVYRDGVQLNATLITGNAFIDTNLAVGGVIAPGMYSYTVRAASAIGILSPASTAAVLAVYAYLPPINLAGVPGDAQAELTWEAPTHAFLGTIVSYNVLRDGVVIADDVEDTFYTDTALVNGTTYLYTITINYYGGIVSAPSNTEAVTPSITSTNDITITKTELYGNFPNPFNPETVIKFALDTDGPVEIVIYNVRGQRVKTLVNRQMVAGMYSLLWDGHDDSGKAVTSGVYFARFITDNHNATLKMMLIK